MVERIKALRLHYGGRRALRERLAAGRAAVGNQACQPRAGVWALWTVLDGDALLSYALTTVNAHALLNRCGQPGSDKRMPVILAEGAHSAWLTTSAAKAKEFLRPYPAQSLTANPVENQADKLPKGWMGVSAAHSGTVDSPLPWPGRPLFSAEARMDEMSTL